MCEDAQGFVPRLPPVRRRLFQEEEADESDESDLAFFLGEEEMLAAALAGEDDDDVGYYDDFESSESDSDSTSSSSIEVISESCSSVDDLTDSGSSIEVLGEDSADFTDEGMFDDGVLYSPFQAVQASNRNNVHNMYYAPISPIHPPWSPESWTSRDLYSPMTSPVTPLHMAGDCLFASSPLDDACANLPPMWWDVTDSTYKTTNSFNSPSLPDTTFYTANNSSSDDGCY